MGSASVPTIDVFVRSTEIESGTSCERRVIVNSQSEELSVAIAECRPQDQAALADDQATEIEIRSLASGRQGNNEGSEIGGYTTEVQVELPGIMEIPRTEVAVSVLDITVDGSAVQGDRSEQRDISPATLERPGEGIEVISIRAGWESVVEEGPSDQGGASPAGEAPEQTKAEVAAGSDDVVADQRRTPTKVAAGDEACAVGRSGSAGQNLWRAQARASSPRRHDGAAERGANSPVRSPCVRSRAQSPCRLTARPSPLPVPRPTSPRPPTPRLIDQFRPPSPVQTESSSSPVRGRGGRQRSGREPLACETPRAVSGRLASAAFRRLLSHVDAVIGPKQMVTRDQMWAVLREFEIGKSGLTEDDESSLNRTIECCRAVGPNDYDVFKLGKMIADSAKMMVSDSAAGKRKTRFQQMACEFARSHYPDLEVRPSTGAGGGDGAPSDGSERGRRLREAPSQDVACGERHGAAKPRESALRRGIESAEIPARVPREARENGATPKGFDTRVQRLRNAAKARQMRESLSLAIPAKSSVTPNPRRRPCAGAAGA